MQVGLPAPRNPLDQLSVLPPARLVITVSATVDRAQRALRPRRRTTIVYPAVDTGRFDPGRVGERREVRLRLGLPADGHIVGTVGRLERWKGFHVLLDAIPRLLERHRDTTFVLVGGPHEHDLGYAEELAARAAALGLGDRVRLVGAQTNPEQWMQAMDVFVHCSQTEPFGMVVIEAMALGKAVVASAEGGPTEVITHGVDGLLTPYGDAAGLARQVGRLLGDDVLRARVAAAAGRRAQDFRVEDFARRFGVAIASAVAA